MIVQFFRGLATQESAKGIKNLVDKIDYFDEEDKILTEKPYQSESEEL